MAQLMYYKDICLEGLEESAINLFRRDSYVFKILSWNLPSIKQEF